MSMIVQTKPRFLYQIYNKSTKNGNRIWSEVLLPRRSMATAYVMGKGWMGALGTGSTKSDQSHSSEIKWSIERDGYMAMEDSHFDYSGLIPLEDEEIASGTILSADCGWGHTALVVENRDRDGGTPELRISGRPHDFQALLRLQRLPLSIVDVVVGLSSFVNAPFGTSEEDDVRQQTCLLPSFTSFELPEEDVPSKVVASAGLTLVCGSTGMLYSFGLNHQGQTGVGTINNNVWLPSPVMGLSGTFAAGNRKDVSQDEEIVDIAAGLQHCAAVDANGIVYTWGKGSRGQLGFGDYETMEFARPLRTLPACQKVAAGFNHTACLSADGTEVFVWGRNVAWDETKRKVADAPRPRKVSGLPTTKVVDVACGSHHTSMLMEDGAVYAIGVASDNNLPLLESAVEIVPPNPHFGTTAGDDDDRNPPPPRYFGCGHDRTTLISHDGVTVWEVQLWSHEDLRKDAYEVPSCITLLAEQRQTQGQPPLKTKLLCRGWNHSLLLVE